MHGLICHALLATTGKELGERTAAAAKCVVVGATIEHPIVGNGNELKAAVPEERPLHSAAAGINAYTKQRDLHQPHTRANRCPVGTPQTGFPWRPRLSVLSQVSKAAMNVASKLR